MNKFWFIILNLILSLNIFQYFNMFLIYWFLDTQQNIWSKFVSVSSGADVLFVLGVAMLFLALYSIIKIFIFVIIDIIGKKDSFTNKMFYKIKTDKNYKSRVLALALCVDIISFLIIEWRSTGYSEFFSETFWFGFILYWIISCTGVLISYLGLVLWLKFKKNHLPVPTMEEIEQHNTKNTNPEQKKFNKLASKFTITSLVVSLILYISFLMVSQGNVSTSWLWRFIPFLWVIIPFLLVWIMNTFLSKMYKKQSKTSKILLIFFNIVIIFFIQPFISGYTLLTANPSEQSYNDVKYYKRAVFSINSKQLVSHFPEKIPLNAQNIELKKDNNSFFGSEEIYLSFDTDKDYIQNELKKYTFPKSEGPFDEENKYDHLFLSLYPQSLKKVGYKVYYLEKPKDIKERCAHGIAVKDNRILYFYTYPD